METLITQEKNASSKVVKPEVPADVDATCLVLHVPHPPSSPRPISPSLKHRSVSVKKELSSKCQTEEEETQTSNATSIGSNKSTSSAVRRSSSTPRVESLTRNRKSLPQVTKVNFGDCEDEESPPPLLPAGQGVASRSKTVNSIPSVNQKKEDSNLEKKQHMSTASLSKKKPSQQGKTARVHAALRKSQADGLHSDGQQHRSTPAVLSNNGPSNVHASVTSRGSVNSSRISSASKMPGSTRESVADKPVIHMYPRKSITGGAGIVRSTSYQNAGNRFGSVTSNVDAIADSRQSHTVPDKNNRMPASPRPSESVYLNPPPKTPPEHSNTDQVPGTAEAAETCLAPLRDENSDYYDYVMLSQRHASSNFITKIGSADLDYGTPETVVKIIGPYILGDQIGKGAYGKVKEGLCSQTLQRVAIKIINKKRLRKIPNGVENALSEIKLLKQMKNRNVITLIDVYCKVEDGEGNIGIFNWFSSIEDSPITWTYDDGSVEDKKVTVLKWYLVFEYCPCSLQTLLEQSEGKKLSLTQTHKFFTQLVDGVGYLHSQSIIHRDIKAGNLLITPDGVVKISDFGVAERFSVYQSGNLMSDVFAGTHQFMAPEICEGIDSFEAEKVDIWACGVTLFNMVTGRYPFEFSEDGNLLGLYETIVAGAFEMPEGLNSDLEDILRGLLDKNPSTRLTIPQIQKHPFYLAYFYENSKPQPPIMSYPSTDFTIETPNSAAIVNKGSAVIRITSAEDELSSVGGKAEPALKKSKTVHGGEQASKQRKASTNSELASKQSSSVVAISMDKRANKYTSIISLHQKETPCETTMIPYLSKLCSHEIEDDLKLNKRFIDMVGRDDDFSAVDSQKSGSPVAVTTSLSPSPRADSLMRRSSERVVERGSPTLVVEEQKLDTGKATKSEGALNEEFQPRRKSAITTFFKKLFHGKDSSVKPQ
ncbi:hypothetical protein CcCBS67573_g07583 [Chytriomyces confervae]|uniref:non-specific serine/threonine protein kinase n=1 Tax=Chytriomyces confervae TaxID=246404 RepID=A0A507EUZ9_9FUNG|nr:hypothetical protein CcCBS67573_g07583 [Chytriomyces confervae]